MLHHVPRYTCGVFIRQHSIMSKSKRYNKIFNKIVNINEDCSENTSGENQYELGQCKVDSESSEYIGSRKIGYWDSEEEHFLNVCHNMKRRPLLFTIKQTEELTGENKDNIYQRTDASFLSHSMSEVISKNITITLTLGLRDSSI
ncbi:uncharacterized protein LOC100652264 [Bombus terrestris]|uniref:Uncharacterized protein LOC100652264 n=1 Tax=Bombus terrestris TaxID=30195 RepID=A0A9C6SHX6_BOMTE|nr:uncharacterized protein LOC100652264 [Bombus terrestris]